MAEIKDNYDLKILKKKYGEDFAKLCRKLFPTLLEKEGLLSDLITSNFYESKNLYHDIVEENYQSGFKRFVIGLVEGEKKLQKFENIESPEVLLDRKGYKLYKCETAEDILKFKKYYASGEVLCTFKEADTRIIENHVFFAVKKNIDEIKRENFSNPEREDDYGTSIMSFQFDKEDSSLYISNRYNHIVKNPDATYSGDLDNIALGLTYSFQKYYGIDLFESLEYFKLPTYKMASDGKYYKCSTPFEDEDGILYHGCGDNIFIENGTPNFKYKEDKSRYEVFEFFILDKQKKIIKTHKKIDYYDSFLDAFYTREKGKFTSSIEKVEIINEGNNRRFLISTNGCQEPAELLVNRSGVLIEYKNPNLREIRDNFLYCNQNLEVLDFPNVKKIGNGFLYYNFYLTKLNLPKTRKIGDECLAKDPHKLTINAPKLYAVGDFDVNNQIIDLASKNRNELGIIFEN